MHNMTNSTLIFLSGWSSVGKTSIAQEIVRLRDGFVHIEADAAFLQKPIAVEGNHYYYKSNRDRLSEALEEGNNIVWEEFMTATKNTLLYYEEYLHSAQSLYLVKVHATVEACKLREVNRGDRRIGTAKMWSGLDEHSIPFYDLEVDTTNLSPAEGASLILEHIAKHKPKAWQLNCESLNIQPISESTH